MIDDIRPGGRELNPQQRGVVGHTRSHKVTVVGAGAGSGKTFTMISTVLDVIERGAGTLDQFALITFTNHAADHLRSELEKSIDHLAEQGDKKTRELWRQQRERLSSTYIGTIHGYCSRLLRVFGFSLRISRSASTTLSRTLQQRALTEELENALAGTPQPDLQPIRQLSLRDYEMRRKLDELVGFCRARGIDLHQLNDATRSETLDGAVDPAREYRAAITALLLRVDERYTELKRQRGVLDVNDLLLQTESLLSNDDGRAIAERIATRTRFVFVDEFQDTNPVQKRILDRLIPCLKGVLVVGDTKQSIFGFLAATPSMLSTLAEEQQVDVLPLSLSKRPTVELLRLQNILFGSIKSHGYELEGLLEPWHNKMPAPGGIKPPLVYHEGIAGDEASRIARHIRDLVGGGAAPGQIVVLARSNKQLADLELSLTQELHGAGVEVRRESGETLFDAPEVIATYHFLRMLLDEDDEIALYEALRTPYLRHLPFQQATVDALNGAPGTLLTWFQATAAHDLVNDLRLSSLEETVPQTLTRIFEETRLLPAYEAAGMDQQAANLQRLKEYARGLTRSDQALTLSAFAANLQIAIQQSYYEEPAEVGDRDSQDVDFVRLLTFHASKGLEFPYVLIPGLSRYLDAPYFDPHFVIDDRSGEPILEIDIRLRGGGSTRSPRFVERLNLTRQASVSEEMRLFYVAVTRGEQAVILFGNQGRDHTASWRHEVMAAETPLRAAGADFV
jgi:ATP-dependent exoDNAse (exonuclease V) beta subunit